MDAGSPSSPPREVRELDSPPALGPLYARALGSLLPGGGERLPDHALALTEAPIDPERLADYCAVCGFGLRDAVPLTYPHVLGFPLALALMTERSFPFSLLGLVHVANRIERLAPLAVGSAPGLRIWAERLRPHRRGRQLDLVTEASVEGEAVWHERSTYLRPGEGSGDKGGAADGDAGGREDRDAGAGEDGGAGVEDGDSDGGPDPAAEGDDDAPATPDHGALTGADQIAIWGVPGDIGRRYAAVSGDRNPIHLHSLGARMLGFPGAIAHGMWSLAHALAALEGRLPERLMAEARFRAPLRLGRRARLLGARRDGGWELALEPVDGGRRHLELAIRERR